MKVVSALSLSHSFSLSHSLTHNPHTLSISLSRSCLSTRFLGSLAFASECTWKKKVGFVRSKENQSISQSSFHPSTHPSIQPTNHPHDSQSQKAHQTRIRRTPNTTSCIPGSGRYLGVLHRQYVYANQLTNLRPIHSIH